MVRTYLYSQIYRQWRIQWGETVQMHPLQKIQKKSFLPIFEGFWAYRPLLCVSYYWECPRHLDNVGRNSYKPPNKQGFT